MSDGPKPEAGEATGAQLTSTQMVGTSTYLGGFQDLVNNLPTTYATYRTMRKHPTLSLARMLSISPVLAGEWSVEKKNENASDEMVQLVQDWVLPLRDELVETAMLGGVDFGWQPFEKVFSLVDNLLVITKLKPLLQDITTILVLRDSGAFAGFKQISPRGMIVVPLEKCFLVPFRMEGTQYHGRSLMETARETYTQWKESNKAAARYDQKIAGANFIVYYPVGTSEDATGADQDNAVLAKAVLAALEATGSVLVPTVLSDYVDELNKQADRLGWRIELLSDKAPKQSSFVARLSYLDALLVRALGLPERALLQGQFGTKAEAGVHADLALTQLDLTHKYVTRMVNWHIVDPLLALNFGEKWKGAVKLVASPLADSRLAYLQDLYREIIKNPAGFQAEYPSLDSDALKETLGVPKSKEIGDDEEKKELLDDVPDETDDSLAASMYAEFTNAS